jgi:ATP-binding cassette subfamily B protein
VAFVFQKTQLFSTSILENVRAARPEATRDEVLSALHAARCDDILAKLPEGMDTKIGSEGTYLSGGEQQRIALARAILKDAPIVLLDEATASLDVENETRVQGALSRLLTGKTVLVIAHRMRTVMGADKVVVLDDGRVAEQGSPQELLAAEGSFARMVRLQADHAGWAL